MSSGYTFIDNSELSVCEKIKQYFAKNPAYTVLDSSISSSSSIELDASFQKLLALQKSNLMQKTIKSEEISAKLEDETIDLCSPQSVSSDCVTPNNNDFTPKSSRKRHEQFSKLKENRKTVNLMSFDDTLLDDCVSLTPSPANYKSLIQPPKLMVSHPREENHRHGSIEIIQNLEPETINKEMDDISPETDEINYSNWLHVSDESFLEQERLCANEDSVEENKLNETQLFDIEAPSLIWNTSQLTHHYSRKPSTILEESTQISSASSSLFNSIITNKSNINDQQQDANKENIVEAATKKLTKSYRPSEIIIAPKRKFRPFFEDINPNLQCTAITRSPVLNESVQLMSFEETIADISGSDNSASICSPFNTGQQFNDTIEAMDFFMEKGKQLQESARKVVKSSSSSPQLLLFSPKSKTPDTIRKRLLKRNLLHSTGSSPIYFGNDRGRIGNIDSTERIQDFNFMARRSVRHFDESFSD